jgi:aldehyde:ferredoxin oxidoreductase
MGMGGFAGNVLHVDLTRGEISKKPLDSSLAEKFIGGLGLTVKLAYDSITPGSDPLSPDNPIVLGAGPLVGTSLPATSRVYAVTKLPQSQTIGWCGGGGVNFGCQLKNAGFDHVVIKGRADKPVYLKVIDDEVEICDASSLWGKGIEETCQSLWKNAPLPAGVVSIGPAGESLVPYSMAFIDRLSTLGRGGFGAVMGSKNLKAIVVKGSKGVEVADRKQYKKLSDELLDTIREYRYLKEWQDLGLVKSLPLVPRETYERIKKRRLACVSCPIGDKDVIEIPDGEFGGTAVCSTSAVNLFIPMIHGMSDYREAIKLASSLDDHGLDIFEFFGVMGFAKKLMDEGILSEDRAEPEINLGSYSSMSAWLEKISSRQGLGDVLARGLGHMIEEFGEEAEKHAPPIIKGMLPYVGPRAPLAWSLFGTMELGQTLDPRGPHVGASGSPTYFAKRPLDVFPRHLKRMGVPDEAIERILPKTDPPGHGDLKVGTLLKYSHAWFATLGSMGICARAQINRFYNFELCAGLYQAVTGIDTGLDTLRERVDRVWTLLRMANMREGVTRESDSPPAKWFEGPGFKDYLTDKPATRQDMEQMIQDYYREWGWDPETGVPTLERLQRLGFE